MYEGPCKQNLHFLFLSSKKHTLHQKYLDTDATISLVHSLVTARMDYCNSILGGIPQQLVNKLQKVQNCAARIIFQKPKFESISKQIEDLNWLRVEQRIIFKIMLMTFKAIHG